MATFGKTVTTGLGMAILSIGLVSDGWGQAGVSAGFVGGGGAGRGESQGVTALTGRVLCTQCDIEEVQTARPDLSRLYDVQHRGGRMVMQVGALDSPIAGSMMGFEDSSEAHWWESIVGLSHSVTVRAPDQVLSQLMAEENLDKRFQIAGVLRPSRVYDVISLAYLESTPSPLAAARQAQEAGRRAQAAADRAEAAADRAVGATARAETSADRLVAASSTAENQFTASLTK